LNRGFGIIYKAKDTKHGNTCALKIIQSGSMSEIQRKDLKSEIITMQTVQAHPNLVSFYAAFGCKNGRETWVLFLLLTYILLSLLLCYKNYF
jgi:serine/threonine protein kinase